MGKNRRVNVVIFIARVHLVLWGLL